MQLSIQAPDNIPLYRIQQRIRELEESLREEARFIHRLSAQAQDKNGIKALLLSMPPAGEDKDFSRRRDLGRSEVLWDS